TNREGSYETASPVQRLRRQDHPDGSADPRRTQERVGRLRVSSTISWEVRESPWLGGARQPFRRRKSSLPRFCIRPQTRSRIPGEWSRTSALRTQSQARHLSFHVRRSPAGGPF